MNKKLITLFLLFVMAFCSLIKKESTAYAETAQSSIVVEVNTGRILYQNNPQIKLPIASLTKIITAIVAIENIDINKQITIKKEWCGIEGSSIYLTTGEILTVKQLLYGLMLRSGNDCAHSIACAIGGTIKNFAVMMNDFSRKIGAKNSNFVNPHGLHDENHYSTANDLAIITAYAMKNKVFREIVSTKNITIPNTNTGEPRYLKNKNKLLFNYDKCIGVKTGYTKKAGRCLASAASYNGMDVVSIVLNCRPMYEESQNIMENAFNNYKLVELCNKDKFEYKHMFKNANTICDAYIKENFCYPMKNEEIKHVKTEIKIDKNINLPIKKDDKIGNMEIYLKNQLIFSQNIYTILDVDKKYNLKFPLENWAM